MKAFASSLALLGLSLSLALPSYAQTTPEQGCSLLASGVRRLPPEARVAVMPMDVELFSMSAGGVIESNAQWSEQASRMLQLVLKQRIKAQSNRDYVFVVEDSLPDMNELNKLHSAVARAIAMHHCGEMRLPTKRGKLDWNLGPDMSNIANATGAQYGLFIYFRDSYASSERKATMATMALLGRAVGGGKQAGYASLINLRTGQVIWFNAVVRGAGDLRDPEGARETISILFTALPD